MGHYLWEIEQAQERDRLMRASVAAKDAEIARLHDLLALIHRDGGQYLDTHGIDKACADAVATASQWRDAQEELDRLRESTRWVPVGDGLPKDGATVDVCGDGFRRTDIVYIPCDHPPGCCTGIWWDRDGDEVYGVTYWMLPLALPTADTPADSKPDFAKTKPVRYVCKP